jgi:aspartyl-tRNA(Asn)/glutamyl-tRNA(Gln) amidotransferase subunit A
MTDVLELSALQLRRLYESAALSPAEATAAVLDRAAALDPAHHIFATLTPELAMAQAKAAEAAYQDPNAPQPPLLGIPVSIKDLTLTRSIRTARGSVRWANWVPDADAPVVERLARAGAVCIGKTNTAELGWKADTGGPFQPAARNPVDPARTAGGSSGGAAAAVRAGLGPLAQGGDAAGSIRVPASFCGVVGFKPSTGLIPLGPAGPLGTLSAYGPLARTVADAELFVAAVAGPHPLDPYSRRTRPLDPRTSRAGASIAWMRWYGDVKIDSEVDHALADAPAVLEALGHRVTEIELDAGPAAEAISALWPAAFAAMLPGPNDDLDPGLTALVEEGRALTPARLTAARAARTAWRRTLRALMDTHDLLAGPATATTAPPIDAGPPAPGTHLANSVVAYPFNLSGQPAVSLPFGTAAGLPVGLQFVGRRGDDAYVLAVAAGVEALTRPDSSRPIPRGTSAGCSSPPAHQTSAAGCR